MTEAEKIELIRDGEPFKIIGGLIPFRVNPETKLLEAYFNHWHVYGRYYFKESFLYTVKKTNRQQDTTIKVSLTDIEILDL